MVPDEDPEGRDAAPSKLNMGDYAHTAVSSALNAVPYVGSPIAVWFQTLVARPLDQRRWAWVEELSARIRVLEERINGFFAKDALERPEVLSTLLEASNIAMRNHAAEKLEALRNAVLNSALGKGPDEERRLILLRLIGELGPITVTALRLAQDPSTYIRPRPNVMESLFVPEFLTRALPGVDRSLAEQILHELSSRGLIDVKLADHRTQMSIHKFVEKRWTTQLGDSLLAFISDPMRSVEEQ
jgi:hypothetical protein